MELVKFNIKNIKYALPKADGEYETPVAYGFARSMALESDTSTKTIFGDGVKIAVIVNDKGKKGSMTTNVVSTDYEIAMGRKMKLESGIADIKQTKSIEHALYFETEALMSDGSIKTAKTWLFNVISSRPSESFDQTEDDINESSFETPIEVKGIKVKYKDGDDYRDTDGNEVFAWKTTVTNEDDAFETFGDQVVLPIVGV